MRTLCHIHEAHLTKQVSLMAHRLAGGALTVLTVLGTWKFFLEYGPCVGGPLRDELTRENKCKVYADFFDMCCPLVSGPAPKFHGGVQRKSLI